MSVELEKPEFSLAFRGYDRQEVDALHKKALEFLLNLEGENERLKAEVAKLRLETEGRRKEERFVQEALVSAQKTADEIRAAAHKAAHRIVEEAKGTAEAEKNAAHKEVETIKQEVERLREDRKRFIEDLGLLLEKYQRELQMVLDTEQSGVDVQFQTAAIP